MHEGLPLKGLFYYCHIHNNGEMIHNSEIGEEVTQEDYYQERFTLTSVSALEVYGEV
ncbi:MAG: hypothetical protein P8Y97_03185 [Candidatus Lokiarchaeota archaeon]